MTRSVSCTVVRSSAADVERMFTEVVAEDVLPKVLHRYRLIPAVVGTEGNTGPWNVTGSQRRIVFSDGGSAREEVLEWISPTRFAYRVDRFSTILGRLVTHATGEWDFTPQDQGSGFRWTYTFFPRHRAIEPLVRLFVRTMWRGYMGQCADRCVHCATTVEQPGSGEPRRYGSR